MKRLESLQGWIQAHFPALVLLMVAGGFALTAAELVYMRHTEETQLVGLVATLLGTVLAVGGIWVRGGGRGFLAGTFVLLACSGIFGMVEHFEEIQEERQGVRWHQPVATWLDRQGSAHADEEGSRERGEKEGEEEEGEHGPPPFAPLSVTGLALMGAVAALAKKE